ncbi:FtsK/SpoIIIE domain-containing protein [Streptantibioticus parmotrematis]|uniref:FtsK/SpoIIIE domain-containing protein n=1 Tax=Streptantibioticus parmotrematis TaxID=2873249 RepID=UPI0033D1BE7F
MQIRLTVLGPRGARARDVLVTAPAGTALGAVAGALATSAGSGQPVRSSGSGSSVVLYAGTRRLDPNASVLGVPPLVDGAVLSLHAPADPGHEGPLHAGHPTPAAPARLLVVGGPDAGGVHLLQGGQVRVGRSADADVPLDDPDVSRLHCVVTLDADGRFSVADLGSTNGTYLDGRPVGPRPMPLAPGALLRTGETTLRLEPAAAHDGGTPPLPPGPPVVPDAEGHLRVTPGSGAGRVPAPRGPLGSGGQGGPGAPTARWSGDGRASGSGTGADAASGAGAPTASGDTSLSDAGPGPSDASPGLSDADARRPGPGDAGSAPGGAFGGGGRADTRDRLPSASRDAVTLAGRGDAPGRTGTGRDAASPGQDTGRGGAIGAWARRIASGRPGGGRAGSGREDADRLAAEAAALRERSPDPATVLVTAIGPGPRLWERGPDHPAALTVRLGTADLSTALGTLPAVPVTVDLRRTGSLALTGPRPRLSGLARAVVAQLCALHSPAALEVVLLSADRARPAEQRVEEWSWLTWLPHLRPSHGQDCRLLLAFDRDQAEARTAELARRLEDGPLGPGWATAGESAVAEAAARRCGPSTLLVVDGDPGSAALRESVARLAQVGPAAGVHVVCLAAAPQEPVARCGATARLDGEVATTLSLSPGGPSHVTVDAVSPAWAERFARALAPLRESDRAGRASRTALPTSARLLDALELAVATPSKVAARWSAGADAPRAALGTGPEGPVTVDLAAEGPHLLVGGAPGSGKTELLRSVTAALAASARPERLELVLVDGAPERGEGLRVCTDLPQVGTHLAAGDPVRMREFAQGLAAELKRREEVLGGMSFDRWQAERALAGQLAAPRARADAGPAERSAQAPEAGRPPSARESARESALEMARGSAQGSLKLRTRAGEELPRLVVVVDDFDALTAPALGSPGRPAAGSVVRAVEAAARAGARLGVHLVLSTGRPERTAGTEADELSRLRIALRTEDPESAALLVHVEDPAGLDEAVPGRGYLRRPDGGVTPFQAGRVSGRIPRTATLRPTVVPLEWERMGDPPTRRTPRELGNGPTDLALLASALVRAAESS